MTVHYVNGFTDSPTADCCGATLALLDASEITLNLDAVTCNQEEPAPSRAQDGDEVPLSVPGRIDIDAVRTDLVKVSNPHMATAARGIVTSRLLGAIPEMLREIRQYRTQTPAPAASSPVPQAVTGTVAEPSAAAAPVARTEALEDLEHALTLALQAMAENDCCADEDDPDWRGPAVEQFRKDLRALGVTDAELDAAGIRLDEDMAAGGAS